MATERQQARQPIDTEAMRALIAKIKREVGDEASAREIGDGLLTMQIEEEVTARQSADAALGRRIDQIPVIEVDPGLDPESANPVENQAVTNAMNGKQDRLTEMTDQEVENLIGSLQ